MIFARVRVWAVWVALLSCAFVLCFPSVCLAAGRRLHWDGSISQYFDVRQNWSQWNGSSWQSPTTKPGSNDTIVFHTSTPGITVHTWTCVVRLNETVSRVEMSGFADATNNGVLQITQNAIKGLVIKAPNNRFTKGLYVDGGDDDFGASPKQSIVIDDKALLTVTVDAGMGGLALKGAGGTVLAAGSVATELTVNGTLSCRGLVMEAAEGAASQLIEIAGQCTCAGNFWIDGAGGNCVQTVTVNSGKILDINSGFRTTGAGDVVSCAGTIQVASSCELAAVSTIDFQSGSKLVLDGSPSGTGTNFAPGGHTYTSVWVDRTSTATLLGSLEATTELMIKSGKLDNTGFHDISAGSVYVLVADGIDYGTIPYDQEATLSITGNPAHFAPHPLSVYSNVEVDLGASIKLWTMLNLAGALRSFGKIDLNGKDVNTFGDVVIVQDGLEDKGTSPGTFAMYGGTSNDPNLLVCGDALFGIFHINRNAHVDASHERVRASAGLGFAPVSTGAGSVNLNSTILSAGASLSVHHANLLNAETAEVVFTGGDTAQLFYNGDEQVSALQFARLALEKASPTATVTAEPQGGTAALSIANKLEISTGTLVINNGIDLAGAEMIVAAEGRIGGNAEFTFRGTSPSSVEVEGTTSIGQVAIDTGATVNLLSDLYVSRFGMAVFSNLNILSDNTLSSSGDIAVWGAVVRGAAAEIKAAGMLEVREYWSGYGPYIRGEVVCGNGLAANNITVRGYETGVGYSYITAIGGDVTATDTIYLHQGTTITTNSGSVIATGDLTVEVMATVRTTSGGVRSLGGTLQSSGAIEASGQYLVHQPLLQADRDLEINAGSVTLRGLTGSPEFAVEVGNTLKNNGKLDVVGKVSVGPGGITTVGASHTDRTSIEGKLTCTGGITNTVPFELVAEYSTVSTIGGPITNFDTMDLYSHLEITADVQNSGDLTLSRPDSSVVIEDGSFRNTGTLRIAATGITLTLQSTAPGTSHMLNLGTIEEGVFENVYFWAKQAGTYELSSPVEAAETIMVRKGVLDAQSNSLTFGRHLYVDRFQEGAELRDPGLVTATCKSPEVNACWLAVPDVTLAGGLTVQAGEAALYVNQPNDPSEFKFTVGSESQAGTNLTVKAGAKFELGPHDVNIVNDLYVENSAALGTSDGSLIMLGGSGVNQKVSI
ncbi:hypothetical protein ACFL59_12770, partial [Planctomycetota bacterium]